jgi:hypothetical protein
MINDNIDLINSINKKLFNIVEKYQLQFQVIVERIDNAFGNSNTQDENHTFDMEYVIKNLNTNISTEIKYLTFIVSKQDDLYEGKIYDQFHKILFKQNYN